MIVEASGVFDYASQPKEGVAVCNLCGDSDSRYIAREDRYGYPARTAKCGRCGLVFLDPRMTREAYAEFYRSGAYRRLVSAFHGREINAKTIQAEQLAYAQQLATFLEPQVSMGGTLLDIGGSTGVVARALAGRFGLRATVLDPAPDELAEASGLRVIQASIEDYEPKGGEWYDLVTLCQTSDHVLDLRGTLAKVKKLIRPRGNGDGARFFVDIVDYEQTKSSKIDHPYNLTRATMLSYLCRAGFRLIDEGRAEDGIHWRFLCA